MSDMKIPGRERLTPRIMGIGIIEMIEPLVE